MNNENEKGLDLDTIEARANAATPGPWAAETREVDHGNGVGDWNFVVMSDGETVRTIGIDDAAHIAGMDPTTTRDLVAEVRRLRKCNTNLRQTLDDRGVAMDRAEAGEAEALAEVRRLRATLERERAALAQTAANLRRVVSENPGVVVIYDVQSIADTLDAIVANGDTSATNAAAAARCEAVAGVVRSGLFHFSTQWSSVYLRATEEP